MNILTEREVKILSFLKDREEFSADEIINIFVIENEPKNYRQSLMVTFRRLIIKLASQGIIIERITKVGRGNKGRFSVKGNIDDLKL